jgi:Tfp pilus assembly protein PilX
MKALPTNSQTLRRSSRQGVTMIIVVVCLIVAGMLLVSLLRTALLHDRQLTYEQYRAQAGWIAEAGLERASRRLALASDYAGETWNIEPGRFGGADGALVVIRIAREETRPSRRKVVVEAVFPVEGPHQARLTRQATMNLSPES